MILISQPIFYDQWFARYQFWTILRLLGPIFTQKNGFCSPFSLITKYILKIDTLRISNQLLSQSFQYINNQPPLSPPPSPLPLSPVNYYFLINLNEVLLIKHGIFPIDDVLFKIIQGGPKASFKVTLFVSLSTHARIP